MNRNPWISIGCVLLAVGGAGSAQGAFELERSGARAAGLEGAYVAVAEGGDLWLYNPAGLANVAVPEVALAHARLLTGLTEGVLYDSRVAYLQPLGPAGALGAVWHQRQLDGLYQENILGLGYGLGLGETRTILVGGQLRLLNLTYQDSQAITDNSFFADGTGVMGLALDLGGLLRVTDQVTVGLSLANLNQPSLALSADPSVVPLYARAGAAYRWPETLITAEGLWRGDQFRIAAGGEHWWFDRMAAARAGVSLGSGGLVELAAGASVRLPLEGLSGQLDYAFLIPVGAFAGAGGTHQLNISVLFGADRNRATARQARILIEAGATARRDGRLAEALEQWEQAAELTPDDEILLANLEILREQIQKNSEIQLFMKQGEDFERSRNLLNAADAYRRALELEPAHAEARGALTRVEQTLEKMTRRQKDLQVRREQEAAARTRQEALRAAQTSIDAARQAVARAQRAAPVPRWHSDDLRQLESQLEEAEGLVREESERAQIMARTVDNEAGKLIRRAQRRQAAERAETKSPGKPPAATPEPAVASTKPRAESAAKTEEQQRLHKRARGAYGRAVKLMLDIDQLRGQTHFPDAYRSLKQDLAGVKRELTADRYDETIRSAEGMFPALETMKRDCAEREKARKAMPVPW